MKFSFAEIRNLKEEEGEKTEAGNRGQEPEDSQPESSEDESDQAPTVASKVPTTNYGLGFDILTWVAANFGGCMLTEAKFRMCVQDRMQYTMDWMSQSDLAFILMVLDRFETLFPVIKKKKEAKTAEKYGLQVRVSAGNSGNGEANPQVSPAEAETGKMKTFGENEQLYRQYKKCIKMMMKKWGEQDRVESGGEGGGRLTKESWEDRFDDKFQDEVEEASATEDDEATGGLDRGRAGGGRAKKQDHASDDVDFEFFEARKRRKQN